MQSNFHTTMIRSASLLAATVLSCPVLPHRHRSLHNDYNLTSDNDYDNDNDNYNYNNDYYNNDGLPYNCQCSLSCNRVCPVSIKSVWMSKCCSTTTTKSPTTNQNDHVRDSYLDIFQKN